MSVEKRPYVGTWSLNNKQVYQHAPDCLVYINGDVTVPNSINLNRQPARLNFQRFITQVSADAGTQPGSGSASISLSIPIHSNEAFVRDANFIFRPGLEVHIYMRGYFPARGMFTRDEPSADPKDIFQSAPEAPIDSTASKSSSGLPTKPNGQPYTREDLFTADKKKMIALGWLDPKSDKPFPFNLTKKFFSDPENYRKSAASDNGPATHDAQQVADNLDLALAGWRTTQQYLEQLGYTQVTMGCSSGFTPFGHDSNPDVKTSAHLKGTGCDPLIKAIPPGGSKVVALDAATTYEINDNLRRAGKLGGKGGLGVYLKKGTSAEGATNVENWSDTRGHYDMGKQRTWVWEGGKSVLKLAEGTPATATKPAVPPDPAYKGKFGAVVNALAAKAKSRFPPPNDSVKKYTENFDSAGLVASTVPLVDGNSERVTPVAESVPVADLGGERQGVPLDDIIAYPYYHVFHGVVTQADISYSSGSQTATLNCSSLLHFWQFHQLASSASYFGSRPNNSKLQQSLTGHPFTGKHPYEIMYTLFHDTAGAAGGVGYALSQKTNQEAKIGGESLWSLNIKYWEKRFQSGRMMKLRLYGATGMLFNSLQSAFLGRLTTNQLNALVRNRFPNSPVQNTTPVFNSAQQLGLVGNQKIRKASNALGKAENSVNNSTIQAQQTAVASTIYGEESAVNAGAFGLADMWAFVKDIGLFGEVNLFETNYQTKLDIANEVTKVTGFEFFQDVDGDFVFKPPFYNMDSSTSRIYRVEDIDLINISFSEKEPNVTYSIGKGSHFKNTVGVGVDGEWGVDGRYVDWRLVAQFGWRQDSFEAMYFTDPRSLFFAAVNRIDIGNVESSSASVTIPLRPEIRVGYPFYIVSYDCYYYCNSFSHSWQAGSQCTTTLQLIGKRSKFFPPGNPRKNGIEKVDLSDTSAPPVTLEVLDSQNRLTLAGFPNVVMALDPTQVNPLFFYTQGELTDLQNPAALAAVVKIAVDKGIITPDPDNPDNPNAYVFAQSENYKGKKFLINADDTIPKKQLGQYAVLTVGAKQKDETIDKALKANNKERDKVLGGLLKKKEKLESKLAGLKVKLSETKEGEESKAASLEQQITAANEDLLGIQEQYDAAAERLNANLDSVSQSFSLDVKLLLELMKLTGDEVLKDKKKIWGDANNTANLLELLSDKKASFNNHGTPGSYRYFSCSHPDPAQQGISFEFNGFGAEIDPNASRLPKPLRTFGFTESSKIARPSDPKVRTPQIELKDQDNFVKRGIWIQRPGSFKLNDGRQSLPFGKSFRVLLSTQEIQTLEFGITRAPNKIDKNSAKTQTIAADFTAPLARGLVAYLMIHLGPTPPAAAAADTLVDAVLGEFQTVASYIKQVYSVDPAAISVNLQDLTKPPPAPPAKKVNIAKIADNIEALEKTLALTKQQRDAVDGNVRIAASKKQESKEYYDQQVKATEAQIAKLKASKAKATTIPAKPKGPNPTPVSKFAANYVPMQTPVVQVYEAMSAAFAGLIQSSFATQYQNLVTSLTKQKKSQAEIDSFLQNKYVTPCQQVLNEFYTTECRQTDGAFVNQPITVKQVSTRKDATNVIYSPVFPVSDDRGYRVLGSYRYGRGISMMSDSILDQLTAADPKSALSQKAIELLVSATNNQQKQTEALKMAVTELSGVYSQNQLRDLGLLDANGTISANAFANLVADGRDSTQQIPATNAAYTLGDLGLLDNAPGATSTRGAESDVFLQAFSMDFVNVVRTGDYSNVKAVNDMMQALVLGPDGQPALDDASVYQAYNMASKSAEWQQRQDDLRGIVPKPSTTTGQQAYNAIKTLVNLTTGEE